MSALQITRLHIQHFCRPNGVLYCATCRRLQTSALKRHKRLFRKNSDVKNRFYEVWTGVDASQFHHWAKLKDGVSITVSGIVRGIARNLKHQLNAKSIEVTATQESFKLAGFTSAKAVEQKEFPRRNCAEINKSGVQADLPVETETGAKNEILNIPLDKTSKPVSEKEIGIKQLTSVIENAEGVTEVWIEQILKSQGDGNILIKSEKGNCAHVTAKHINDVSIGMVDDILITDVALPKTQPSSQSKWSASIYYFSRAKKSKSDVGKTSSSDSENNAKTGEPQDTNENKNQPVAVNENLQATVSKNSSATLANRLKESFSSSKKASSSEAKQESTTDKDTDKDTKVIDKDSGVVEKAESIMPFESENVLKDQKVKQKLAEEEKSYLDMIWKLPQNIGFGSSKDKDKVAVEQQLTQSLVHGELLAESGLSEYTKTLSENLMQAHSVSAKKSGLNKLCSHLIHYPQFRHIVYEVCIF